MSFFVDFVTSLSMGTLLKVCGQTVLLNFSSTKVDFSLSADIRSCSEYYKKRCCVGGWREDKVEENNQSRDVTEDSIDTSPFTTTIQPAYELSFLNIESCKVNGSLNNN